MKRLTSAAAVLLLFMAVPLFASERRLVDDVIRMSKAGVSEDAIIVFVQNTRGSVDVSADDIIAMTEAGLPKPLIKAVIDEAARRRNSRPANGYNGYGYGAPPMYYGYGAPYYYSPYYYYDPFWYGPRVYLSFGGYFGGHRGFRRHR